MDEQSAAPITRPKIFGLPTSTLQDNVSRSRIFGENTTPIKKSRIPLPDAPPRPKVAEEPPRANKTGVAVGQS